MNIESYNRWKISSFENYRSIRFDEEKKKRKRKSVREEKRLSPFDERSEQLHVQPRFVATHRVRTLACSRTRNRIVLMPFKLIELENESMWRYGTIKEGEGGGAVGKSGGGREEEGERERERERLESGFGWMDTQKGAHGCATTQPLPVPANSAAARHSDRSTGSNATTAYYASPSLCLSVFLSFHPLCFSVRPSVHPFSSSILPALILGPTLSSPFTISCHSHVRARGGT